MARCWSFVILLVCMLMPAVLRADAPAVDYARNGGVRVMQATSLILGKSSSLLEGDLLLAYRVASAGEAAERMEIRDALHWRVFEVGELMRQPVTLYVWRDGKSIAVPLADGWARLRVRSNTAPSALELADDALQDGVLARDRVAAESAYQAASAAMGTDADADTRAMIALHGARAAMAFDDWQVGRDRLAPLLIESTPALLRISLMEADIRCTGYLGAWRVSLKTLQTALAILDKEAPHTLAHARIASALAQIESFSDPKPALVRAEAAVADARSACGRCEALGLVQVWHGDALSAMGRIEDAAAAFAESIEITRALTPDDVALATRLMRHARTLRLSGRPDRAERQLHEALALMRSLSVPALEVAPVLNALGTVAHEQGDLDAARAWYQQSLDITAKLAPDTIDAANAHHNLAQADMTLGDYVSAERHLQAGIDTMEKSDNGLYLGVFLTSQAQLEIQRGNDEAAEGILQRVRAVQTKINPEAFTLGITEIELAKLQQRAGRMRDADASWARAMAIFAKQPADSFVLAEPLAEFGYSELGLGRLDSAQDHFQKAYQLFQLHAPDSLRSTIALQGAGETALARRDYAPARLLLEQALTIRRRDAPDTARVAQTLHALGRIERAQQHSVEARSRFCEAAEILDRASLHSGGGDLGETRFRAQYAQVYHDCLAASVRAGDSAAAVAVLERSRARGFRHALEQRRLRPVMPAQRQAISNLGRNALAYEQALDNANDPNQSDDARANARRRAQLLQAQRIGLSTALSKSVPAFAAAYLTSGVDVSSLQSGLADADAYVAYSIGDDDTVVLVVRRGAPLLALTLPLTRRVLEERVRAFRSSIVDPATTNARLNQQSAELHDALLEPVAERLKGARRLLVSADGPLHDLPFAALWQSDAEHYLIESYALIMVDSLSGLHQAQDRTALDGVDTRLLAVGDPGRGGSPSPEVARRLRSARGDVAALPALPAARREVQALAERYPRRTQLLVGAAATEKRVRALAQRAGQIHFAVHALFDVSHPLDSALVLSPGANDPVDDGLLQVWEIFEGLPLRASLVVLSGCDTAAGQQFAGEGLLGFSRAFAFAGAHATVASLWPVEDDSTAELMERFYDARDRNLDDAQALQAAMLAMIHSDQSPGSAGRRRGVGGLAPRVLGAGGARRPQDWAAFELFAQ